MTNWKKKVDVKQWFTHEHDNDDEFVVSQMRGATDAARGQLAHDAGRDDDLSQILEELQDAADDGDIDWWNAVWDALYDWADANRVWIATV